MPNTIASKETLDEQQQRWAAGPAERVKRLQTAINSYRGTGTLLVGPVGSRNDWLVYDRGTALVQTGCFLGTLDEFEQDVRKKYAGTAPSIFLAPYLAAIAWLRLQAAMEPQTLAQMADYDFGC